MPSHIFSKPAIQKPAVDNQALKTLEIKPEYKHVLEAPETIAEEASRLVNGARQGDYGHPLDDFTKTAKLWEVIIGQNVKITPEQIALCMVAVKISRQLNKPKRDNLVDAIGYIQTLDMVIEEREKRKSLA